MALGIAVELNGATSPQVVRLTVTGLTPGEAFTVQGAAGSFTWTVPGGNGQLAGGTSTILADAVGAPLGVAVTYTATVSGASVSAAPITVPFDGRYVLQSPDGRTVVPFVWQDNGLPAEERLRSSRFDVPGRSKPVVRWDVSAGESGTISARLTKSASTTLRTYLRTRGPLLVLRTDGALPDVEPVQVVALRSAAGSLWGAAHQPDSRVWSLTYDVIDTPDLSVALAASTWDDFDAVYAASSWTAFDAEWAALTWDDFDGTDWSTY